MTPNPPTDSSPTERAYPRRSGQPRETDPHQQVIQRRAIAAGGVILFLILIVFLAKGCASAAKERGIKDFVNQSNSIITQSNQSSRDFFNLVRSPGESGATEIETSINEQRSLSSELVRQAGNVDAPGEMDEAKRYLIETLEFRRDGLTQISQQIGQALGDQDPETASEQIAANMQNFLTSDVIYSQRAYAYMADAIKTNKIEGVKPPSSQFLPSLDWLDPAIVSDILDRARGGSGSDTPVAPGLHGTSITGVSAQPSGSVLADGVSLSGARSIAVDVTNQGENDETEVVVTVTISGAGPRIPLRDTIAKIAAGETKKVTIPLTRTPAAGSTATLKVDVRRVPGEENTDNNSQSFSVKF
ncbi:MAG: CARDB domain-containing protein [Solirubrobacterales bacterium]